MYYTVKKGDTLSKIATAHGVTTAQLLEWNPEITDANLIRVGQQIRVTAPDTEPNYYTREEVDNLLAPINHALEITEEAIGTINAFIESQQIVNQAIQAEIGDLADADTQLSNRVEALDSAVGFMDARLTVLEGSDPEPPPPPPPPPVCPEGAITLAPGSNIQAAVNAAPVGAVFCLQPGNWFGQTITPKANQQFIGLPGATLNGNGTVLYAFIGSAANVKLQGLRITNYSKVNEPWASAPINPEGSTGWQVLHCEIDNNKGGGMFMRGVSLVEDCDIHHNGQIGLLAGSGSSITVRRNKIHHNNTDLHDPFWEAGGTKFFRTVKALVENNEVYSNHGPGLWCDEHNTESVIRNNHCYDNFGPGIFQEIGYEAEIYDNLVVNNGHGFTSGLDGAGILVFSCEGVEIHHNTLIGNRMGICGKHANRGSGPRGTFELRSMNVHDNQVNVGSGRTGIDANTAQANVYNNWGNTYQGNHYVGQSGNRFQWQSGNQNFAAWQAGGRDTTGSFTVG